MKCKWNSPAQLSKRWDQLTRKLPHKSVRCIDDFYHAMVSHVHGLLSLVHVHLNIDSSDEIRLALSCWHRVCSSELDISNPLHKKRLAGRLKHTLFKSRKSSEAAMSSKNAKKSGTLQNQQPTASTIFSMLSSNNVTATTSTAPKQSSIPAVVHTPLVRKKRPRVSPSASATPVLVALTPPSLSGTSMSLSGTPAGVDAPKRQKLSPLATDARKRQIKVRFVPIDKVTQALVTDIGARPKVELSMNGSKRISDVCQHMMTKWAAVQSSDPTATMQFRVVPLGDRVHPGWSVNDISVTCLDILHQCPPQPATDDDTVTLEYRWELTPALSLGELLPTPHKPPSPSQSHPASEDATFVNLNFLPVPPRHPNEDDTDNEPWHDLRDLSPPLTHPAHAAAPPDAAMSLASTDFNSFLDEGPGACTAWMESFLPPPPPPEPSVDHAPDKCRNAVWPQQPDKPTKKRITPTLISQPTAS
ncbi:hypothetical protein DYB32_008303 [Aphanomyces invadans]|uniref:Uncharacterized protein n=1 Tax=Aphanomyces invadans TaxID=157072 RepID=A0A3R6VGW7_9STRA|nr:hypothetical protein DYB32_008303 [Aphanomyces invadans]